MSKSKNATRRFKQGRINNKKLQSLLSKYKQEELSLPKLEVEEHIHSEHCNHNLPELMPDPDDQEVEV